MSKHYADKHQTAKIGGKYGPGIVNNPGWSSDLNYANSTRHDKASKPVKEEKASGEPEYRPSNGLFEKQSRNTEVVSRGQKLPPAKYYNGLRGEGSGLQR